MVIHVDPEMSELVRDNPCLSVGTTGFPQVKLDMGMTIYAPLDTDDCIRKAEGTTLKRRNCWDGVVCFSMKNSSTYPLVI